VPTKVLVLAVMFDRRHTRPNPNRETSAGHTPLTRAAEYGRMYAIQALLDRGADINYQVCMCMCMWMCMCLCAWVFVLVSLAMHVHVSVQRSRK